MVSHQAGSANAAKSRVSAEEAARAARDRLLQKISSESDLPALGGSVSRVVQMTSSDDEAVRNLARFILSDVALTQKVLRIANTVTYRTAAASQVTTVSKAIFILGFETVKTAALAMILVDRLAGPHAKAVRTELGHALCASIVGREIARRSQFKDAEEAAIAALFKNIGRVLVAAHDPRTYDRIIGLVETGSHTPAQASLEVLGCSFELLAEAVLREWNMPETIIAALVPPPPGVLKPAKARQEWLQQAAAFSSAAARLIPQHGEAGQEAATRAVLTRFGTALGLDHARIGQMFADVAEETRTLSMNVDLALHEEHAEHDAQAPAVQEASADAKGSDQGLPGDLLMSAPNEGQALQVVQRHASGKPMNARDLLLAGVQDVTQMMAAGRCNVNDLMLLVLETLYSGLGFRFATVCLKDPQNNRYRARIAIGEQAGERQGAFAFPSTPARDLFTLSMENDADLMISDASVPKIRDLLPAWHKTLLPDARSFIVLPLVLQKRQLGFFYADRAQAAPEGVPPDETALIKTLKGQVLAAIQSR